MGGDHDDLTNRKVRAQVEGILGNKYGPITRFKKLISEEIDSLLEHTQKLQKQTQKTLVKEVVEAEIMTEKKAKRLSKAALGKELATHMAQREQEALTQRQCTGKEGGPVCPDDDEVTSSFVEHCDCTGTALALHYDCAGTNATTKAL